MENLKIVHIIPSLGKGGAERLAVDICNEQSNIPGLTVKLVLLTNWNDYQHLTTNLDVEIIEAKYTPSITGKAVNKVDDLVKLFNEFKPDVIHMHRFEAEMVTRATKYYNALYVTHCHYNTVEYKKAGIKTFFNKGSITKYFDRYIILKHSLKAKANLYIAISKDTHNYFITNLPALLRKNVTTMLNAIDFKLFSKLKTPDPPVNKILLINTGTLIPRKNQQYLIRVLAALIEKKTDATLTLLGYGEQRDNLIKLASALNVTKHVNMPGIVPDVEKHLAKNHIYLHSALFEPFGLVQVEAMATGLPVIALDGQGNRDVNVEGKTGYLLPAHTKPEEFAEKIISLASNRELYSKMSNYARSFAAGFDIENYTQKLLQEYKKLL